MEEFTNQQILDAVQVMPLRVLVKSEDDKNALLEFMHDNGFEWNSGKSLLAASPWCNNGMYIGYVFQKTPEGRCITTYVTYTDEWDFGEADGKTVVYRPQQVEFAISFDDLFSKN